MATPHVEAECLRPAPDLRRSPARILCGKAGTADIVDATVVVMAASLGAIIWTSDPYGIRALIDAQDVKPAPVIRTV